MRMLFFALMITLCGCVLAGCGRKEVPAARQRSREATSGVAQKTAGNVPKGAATDKPEAAGGDTNRMAEIVSRLLEEPRKGPPTNRIAQTGSESRIVGDPREKVREAMELVVKNADRELALLTRQRHETELRLRESDPVIKEAFSSFVRSRDEYYRILEANAEYQRALEKEAEAYSALTNAMARLDAIKEGSKKK